MSLQFKTAPTDDWTLGLDLRGQLTDHALPRQQQWVLGGDQALAAWLPGVIVGDRGYLARVHLGRSISLSAWHLHPRLFVETGGGAFARDDGEHRNVHGLADAGLELGVEHDRHVSIRIVAAKPLVEPNHLKPDLAPLRAEVFFQASLRF